MNRLLVLLLILLLSACNQGGGGNGAFGGLGVVEDPGTGVSDPLSIKSFTPETDNIVLTNSTSAVFGVNIAGGSGNVNYDFILDNDASSPLYTGTNAFQTIQGTSLTPGAHELKVVARDETTSDDKVFNVRKNRPPTILIPDPMTNSIINLNCGAQSQTFSAFVNDLDAEDTYQITWILDSQVVNAVTPFTTRTDTLALKRSEVMYAPDCTKVGSHTLIMRVSDGYESSEINWVFNVVNPPVDPEEVQIISFIPVLSPVVMTNTSQTTFGVTVAEGSGVINYKFILDGDIANPVQEGATSFYTLSGNGLLAGLHFLKVIATNGITSAEKQFTIRKNSPPNVGNFTPALNGNTINCSSTSLTINAAIGDINNDTISGTWKIDESLVTPTTPYVTSNFTASSTSLTYTPDCSQIGTHTLKLTLSDGYEEFSQVWVVTVNNPAPPLGTVQIISFIPILNPVVMNNNSQTTFGVTVAEGSGNITYKFTLDGDLANPLQDSNTSFYTLSGSGLSSGLHLLKVVATNGITTAEKQFSIRKNSPPHINNYSPSLTGNTINCSGGSITLNANIGDVNGDTVTSSWKLDESAVTGLTPFVAATSTVSNASIIYTPDCNQLGTHSFKLTLNDGYEDFTQIWVVTVNNPAPPPGDVQITSFSPTTTPVVMTSTSQTTFGVTVADGSGTIDYKFILDGDEANPVAESGTSFYTLSGASLVSGLHLLKVVATNGITTAQKQFSIRKNSPPVVTYYTPSLTGNSINCSNASISISANIADSNSDPMTVSWKVDEVEVNGLTPFVTTNSNSSSTSLTYTPDCTQAGFHTFKVIINDGYEDTTLNWAVAVNNPAPPPGAVQISTFTPSVSPVVVTETSSTTFAVSVADGAGVISYEFKRDGVEVLQNGSNPFYILNGSSMTVGTHTLKAKASNGITYDEKNFSIRRNALPSFVTYSPATTGLTFNCGASVTFDSTIIDNDSDPITKKWYLDGAEVNNTVTGVTIASTANTSNMVYVTDCSKTGNHVVMLKGDDSYETSSMSWSFTVINPAQETLGAVTPSAASVVALSTESTKTFTATASNGIAPFTFTWKIKRDGFPDVTKLIESDVPSSTLVLNTSSDLAFGDQTLNVTLTDSTNANDPVSPAERSWTVYRNQKPQITSVTPSSAKLINSNSTLNLSATITDASDTFTVAINRGSSSCSTPASCGLSSVVSPTTTGTYSAAFKSGTTFIGDNTFTLNVTDSRGESSSATFNINANFFSDACNNLTSGQICTLAGMPGMGEGLDITLSDNSTKVRIQPLFLSLHNVGATNKNMIIADVSQSIWYWNRNSTSIQLGPYTIAANSAKIILGAPGFQGTVTTAASFGTQTVTSLRNFQLNASYGLTNTTSGIGGSQITNIYIGEINGGPRVLRLQFNNVTASASVLPSANISGCSNQNNIGANFTLDLTVDTASTPNRLYAACTANSLISSLDLSQANAFATSSAYAFSTVASSGASPHVDGVLGAGAVVYQPTGIYFDPTSRLIYFGENGTCRVRAMNLPGGPGTVNLFDTWSITANSIKTIAGGLNGGTWCNMQTGYYRTVTTAQFGNVRGVIPYRLGGTLRGFFVSDSYHRVVFLNNTDATITIGNRSVPAYSSGVVFGLNNVAGSTNNNNAAAGGKSSLLNNPYDIEIDGGSLFVADYGNSRIRRLVIDNNAETPSIVASGTVSTAIGSIPKAGYNESPTLQSQMVQMNGPRALKFDSTNNRLLFNDYSNRRIRSLNLSTGVVDTLIGNGGYSAQTSQVSPLLANTMNVFDLDMLKYGGLEYMIFPDNGGGSGQLIRAYNSYGDLQNILSVDIDAGRISAVAGMASQASWNAVNLPLYNNQPAIITPMLDIYGLGSDGPSNTIYIADRSDHCIKKIDGFSGVISVYAGLCGTQGTTGGTLANARFQFPWDIEMDPLYPGNFFVVDASNSATSLLKYVNTSGTPRSILGTVVAAQSVANLGLSIQPNLASALAVSADQVCIASGQYASPNNPGLMAVTCYSRANSALSLYIGNKNEPDLSVTNYFRGRQQSYTEHEGMGMGYGDGLDPINLPVTLAGPEGLAFDPSGNLYISETRGHTIRMVKRWYP